MYLLRGLDSNQRFPTYEDGEMTNFSTPQYMIDYCELAVYQGDTFL